MRAGATLLFDSDPNAEEAETELKASAMRDAVLRPEPDAAEAAAGADDGAVAPAQALFLKGGATRVVLVHGGLLHLGRRALLWLDTCQVDGGHFYFGRRATLTSGLNRRFVSGLDFVFWTRVRRTRPHGPPS